MNADFWLSKWDKNEIGFHAAEVNPFLQVHFAALGVPLGGRVFVPLCGKSRDLKWLMSQGFNVVGVELSEVAIVQLFEDLRLVPNVVQLGAVTRYSGAGITVFVGDVFDVSTQMIGDIHAVYDRAALVALPSEVRPKYAEHVAAITEQAPQLVVTFEYDQNAMSGPPFSITADMVLGLFGPQYDVALVEERAVEGGFKGRIPAVEKAWVLPSR